VLTHAKATLTVAKRMTNSLKTLFPKAEVFTHHNVVELIPPELFLKERPDELQGKQIILCSAMFAARKGGPLLIEAFARIANRYPKAVLRIVGSGPDFENMKQTINHLGITGQVQVVGSKPHNEVLQEMAWADCFALVGWDEPFATVYLEAMAAGKPIICCSDGGINDVIVNEVHGLTLPPKDVAATAVALERMLSDENKRHKMGDNGKILVIEKLTWERQSQELLNIFGMAIHT
jgi:glycosyltransferase involved in cell wall biosynthesis